MSSSMPAFMVLPRRWVMARPSAGIRRDRRLSRADAARPERSATLVDVAMSRLMLRRLACAAPYGVRRPQPQGLKRARTGVLNSRYHPPLP
jgi:hypothetical protein